MSAGDPDSAGRVALILASRSPQRRAILQLVGIPFTVRGGDVAELDRGDPEWVTVENARHKAAAAGGREGEVVLGADTVVVAGGRIFGKPAGEAEAREMLSLLSGATHSVLSGICLAEGGRERTAITRTEVSFRRLGASVLEWYLQSGEWRGRAGGYAIQSRGAVLVCAVHGDYLNVVGLPLATLLDLEPRLLPPSSPPAG